MSEIERYHGQAPGRTRASAWKDLVFAVAVTTDDALTFAEQTHHTLAAIDENLRDAGSDRTRILNATVYITDMANKPELDEIWTAWIGPPEHWPQRACVQVELTPGALVEVTTVAARD